MSVRLQWAAPGVDDTDRMIGPDFAATLAAAQNGDEGAFSRLWRDAHPALLRYLRSMAGTAADDLASETWLAVLGGLGRFRGDEPKFRAWLFTIARRKLIDSVRRDRSDRHRPIEGLDPLNEPAGPDAHEVVGERMATQAALRLIGSLPPDQAEIILLRVVAGLEVAQVAAIVGKSPGAVRVAAHRALRTLAAAVAARDRAAEAAVPTPSEPVAVTPGRPAAFRRRDA